MNVLSGILFVAHCVWAIGAASVILLMFIYFIMLVIETSRIISFRKLIVPNFVIRGAKFEPDGTLYSAYGHAENIAKAYTSAEKNEKFIIGGVPCFLVSVDSHGNVEFRPVRYFERTGA